MMKSPFRALLAVAGIVLLGLSVRADDGDGPAGPTLNLSVDVTDSSGGTLRHRWKSTDGSTRNVDSAHTQWTLPAGRGLHFVHVLVSNGLGGYTERRVVVSTDNQPALHIEDQVYLQDPTRVCDCQGGASYEPILSETDSHRKSTGLLATAFYY
jgi:hypothetical protein